MERRRRPNLRHLSAIPHIIRASSRDKSCRQSRLTRRNNHFRQLKTLSSEEWVAFLRSRGILRRPFVRRMGGIQGSPYKRLWRQLLKLLQKML
jgi:hypothetical protein